MQVARRVLQFSTKAECVAACHDPTLPAHSRGPPYKALAEEDDPRIRVKRSLEGATVRHVDLITKEDLDRLLSDQEASAALRAATGLSNTEVRTVFQKSMRAARITARSLEGVGLQYGVDSLSKRTREAWRLRVRAVGDACGQSRPVWDFLRGVGDQILNALSYMVVRGCRAHEGPRLVNAVHAAFDAAEDGLVADMVRGVREMGGADVLLPELVEASLAAHLAAPVDVGADFWQMSQALVAVSEIYNPVDHMLGLGLADASMPNDRQTMTANWRILLWDDEWREEPADVALYDPRMSGDPSFWTAFRLSEVDSDATRTAVEHVESVMSVDLELGVGTRFGLVVTHEEMPVNQRVGDGVSADVAAAIPRWADDPRGRPVVYVWAADPGQGWMEPARADLQNLLDQAVGTYQVSGVTHRLPARRAICTDDISRRLRRYVATMHPDRYTEAGAAEVGRAAVSAYLRWKSMLRNVQTGAGLVALERDVVEAAVGQKPAGWVGRTVTSGHYASVFWARDISLALTLRPR